MILDHAAPRNAKGARATVPARNLRRFVTQYVLPLFFWRTEDVPNARGSKSFVSEEQFWGESENVLLATVSLDRFRVTDWFPRTPGVFWSKSGKRARGTVYSESSKTD